MIHPPLCLDSPSSPHPNLRSTPQPLQPQGWVSRASRSPPCLSATGIFTQPQDVSVWNNSGEVGSPWDPTSRKQQQKCAGESAEPAGVQGTLSQGRLCLPEEQLPAPQGQHLGETRG